MFNIRSDSPQGDYVLLEHVQKHVAFFFVSPIWVKRPPIPVARQGKPFKSGCRIRAVTIHFWRVTKFSDIFMIAASALIIY